MRPFDKFPDETELARRLAADSGLTETDRAAISKRAADLVRAIRGGGSPGLMEVFLAEYGLSTDEGVALMCLAEALLRVPDAETIDDLIEDKIAPSDWGKHLGHSSSSLVNASTWALMLTGRVLDDKAEPGLTTTLRNAVKRVGEPVIRAASARAMKEMGNQFVLGETMKSALKRAEKREAQGYTYSYDMLGEAARTMADADRYTRAYADAIATIAKAAKGNDIRTRPGISVKLSALHPRYEVAKHARVMEELVPRLADLAAAAAEADIGFNIDAEEADRLEISLDVIEAVLRDPRLDGWKGFGVVVQAYGLRAGRVLDWLYALNRPLMVRLVKGAYWDTEIKKAQVDGMARFPVFSSKAATDVSYIANAKKLLGMTDRIYPQFATHNAHTCAAIIHMANDLQSFEFQRLHGMGEKLHDILMEKHKTRCRIYAPVGAHRDLLAYLVRRLLENGANSSFVNQVVDEDVPPEQVATDPFTRIGEKTRVATGRDLFAPHRQNSTGWDLSDGLTLECFEDVRAPFREAEWQAGPLIVAKAEDGPSHDVTNPARPGDRVGRVQFATAGDAAKAIASAKPWTAPADERARVLNRVADIYEENSGELFAILAREAGKIPLDAVGEIREAVDFLRYYASLAPTLAGEPIGTVACISPWNFPLAIFTGQIAGALSAGCAVLAKPAEQTSIVAFRAAQMMHDAGVPRDAMQLLPGDGATVGKAITSDPLVNGAAFTGSTDTAQLIRRAMAENLAPGAPLVAETGGLNAMIVDSTALPEQAVRDIVASAFQSAGQRCSALRCLYVQKDVAKHFREMLYGAMDELAVGDPWHLSTDVGPLIDLEAHDGIAAYLSGKKIAHQVSAPDKGHFLPPTVVDVGGIAEMDREIFGPVLHIAEYKAADLPRVISDINSKGFGLTFGLHTRIDSRVQEIVEAIHCGNIYVNRNQIGAVVGSQPFGGEGLSGTGPKAGGPAYPHRFRTAGGPSKFHTREMPGPTGETNRLSHAPRGPFLALGPSSADVSAQIAAVEALGGSAIDGSNLKPNDLETREGFAGALWWGDAEGARARAKALAKRKGAILPLLTGEPRAFEIMLERHLCVDTTASGGNAQLLAEVGGA